jgi:hypothetical protein
LRRHCRRAGRRQTPARLKTREVVANLVLAIHLLLEQIEFDPALLQTLLRGLGLKTHHLLLERVFQRTLICLPESAHPTA